ncbi:Tetratricopeptide repeat (TPR) superfamily protein [Trifolium repens]|nr:Tetratricopeptide repeat (TPR) superfamily protein [Trifolium repens]
MWTTSSFRLLPFRVNCSSDDGFGGDNNKTTNNKAVNKGSSLSQQQQQQNQRRSSRSNRKSTSQPPPPPPPPRLTSQLDIDFEERLKAVRRSALDQKKAEQIKEFGPIDYDAPISLDNNNNNNKTIGFGTKLGIGVAVAVFGLVFALGDFLPSGSPNQDTAVVNDKLSDKDKAALQNRLKEFEATLSNSPRDPTALEGAAVTLAELGEYARAASLLDDLTKEKPNDAEAFRLLGEVKYELKDYEGSVVAYKDSAKVSEDIKFDVLRGLTNSLLAAKKPDEAVQLLLACRDRLSSEDFNKKSESSPTDSQKLDPIQVELLLGKAYSDWGHVGDAIAVYDQLISTHPDDFRGYLAKGIILKENKNIGDAERMFIQARFFAPDKAKALVDRYSR